MTENRDYTVCQLCERLGISRRNLYYYLDFFREAGFIVEKRGTCYSLDRNSPFFTKLFRTVHFTEDEALVMRRLLDAADANNIQVRHLRMKLERLYDLDILDSVAMRGQTAGCISVLYDAIKYKNKVILRNYSSPHSNTVTNRIVEPFMFLSHNSEIRGYEISSGMNKTFKISRMESVEMLSDGWEHETRHKRMYTDIFMFSSEQRLPVALRLDRLAYSLLVEEYPQASCCVCQESAGSWILRTDVCSYVGVSRFVLGLFDDIEILGTDEFRHYIEDKTDRMRLAR